MGRPRQHDDTTREALLTAAEHLLETGGLTALSVRAVADETGTTTRAVYSLFGSKDGLLAALAQRSFELLRDALARLPITDDPSQDLVEAALRVFRPMAIDHPSMFRVAFLSAVPGLECGEAARAASEEGFRLLCQRVQRVADAGRLGGRSVMVAAMEFNALCVGLATTELWGPAIMGTDPERVWRDAFQTLISGFHTPIPHRRTSSKPVRR